MKKSNLVLTIIALLSVFSLVLGASGVGGFLGEMITPYQVFGNTGFSSNTDLNSLTSIQLKTMTSPADFGRAVSMTVQLSGVGPYTAVRGLFYSAGGQFLASTPLINSYEIPDLGGSTTWLTFPIDYVGTPSTVYKIGIVTSGGYYVGLGAGVDYLYSGTQTYWSSPPASLSSVGPFTPTSTYSALNLYVTYAPIAVPTATPTVVPTSTPTVVPTATPTPTFPTVTPYYATPTPVPTASPTPISTPTPTVPAVYYSVSVSASPAGAGTAYSSTGGSSVVAGSTVTLTAASNSGYAFDHWQEISPYVGAIYQYPLSFAIDHNYVFEAVFRSTATPAPTATNTPAPQLYATNFVSNLPNGVAWSIFCNGNNYYSSASTITVNLPSGAYSYSLGSISGYALVSSSSGIVQSGGSVTVLFESNPQTTAAPQVSVSPTVTPSASPLPLPSASATLPPPSVLPPTVTPNPNLPQNQPSNSASEANTVFVIGGLVGLCLSGVGFVVNPANRKH